MASQGTGSEHIRSQELGTATGNDWPYDAAPRLHGAVVRGRASDARRQRFGDRFPLTPVARSAPNRGLPRDPSALRQRSVGPNLERLFEHRAQFQAAARGSFVLSSLPGGETMIRCEASAIHLVIEGEQTYEIDGRSIVLRSGRMLLVDRGTPYRLCVRPGVHSNALSIYLPANRSTSCGLNFPARTLLQSVDASQLGALLEQGAKRLQIDADQNHPLELLMAQIHAALPPILTLAAASMERLDAIKPSTRQALYNRLECARAYLHDYKDRAVSLEELAKAAAMSSFQLSRYFALAFGAPPSRYHRRIRLLAAAARLQRGEASVTDVAFDTGYSELSAFSHAFAREFGCPPSAINSKLASQEGPSIGMGW